MKTIANIQKNAQRTITIIVLFIVLGIAANAQTRSYTLSILQKTDYVINEAYDITDYFYFNDGEFIAKAVYFQDYAYNLYDSRHYKQAIQYSLMARSYAINAIEICDDYWHYYDYHYYGYSPVWGRNVNHVVIVNPQLHWGLTNAVYHNNMRVNWNLYFTTREWSYYRNLPTEIVLLNGLYQHRGGTIYFNDRFVNVHLYRNMQVRINSGRDVFVKSHPKAVVNMAPKPKDIRPNNAPVPSNTRRATVNENLQFNHNANNNSNTSRTNAPNNENLNESVGRRRPNNTSTDNSYNNDTARATGARANYTRRTNNTSTNNYPNNDAGRTNTDPRDNSSSNYIRKPSNTSTNNSYNNDTARTNYTRRPNNTSTDNYPNNDAGRTNTGRENRNYENNTGRPANVNSNNTRPATNSSDNKSVQDNSRRNTQNASPSTQVNNRSNSNQNSQTRQQTQQNDTNRSQTTRSSSSRR